MAQAPIAQALTAACARLQTVPHVPQLAGSTATLAQYCDGAVPQVLRGAAQVAAQVPMEHT